MLESPPRLAVYTSDAAFLLQPPGADWACLAVDRATGAVSLRRVLSDAERRALPAPVSATALLGVMPLGGVAALAVVTHRVRCATLPGGAQLWRVTRCRVLACPPGGAALTPAQADYARLLRLALAEPGLFYADAADATRAQQDALPDDATKALAERADPRFFWNAALAAPVLACQGAAAHVVPAFCGFAAEALCSDGLTAQLLARRHVGRPGRRLWARGCDAGGAAANCVATEQTLRSADGDVACHVTVRGSVPLLWAQPPDLRPKPRIRLVPPPGEPGWAASLAAYRTHQAALRGAYGGPVTSLSLLRHRGREAPLADAFQAAASEAGAPGDTHIAFDFNARAGASPQGRAALLGLLRPHLRSAGVFHRRSAGGKASRRQAGVLRVNCLDVLDRTNMAQAAAAGLAAAMQLAALRGEQAAPPAEAIRSDDAAANDADPPLPAPLAAALASLWRAHGDAVAMQYTRTGAQRRDRSAPASVAAFAAVARDALISLRRYVQNNHGDAAACDAAALLAGTHRASRSGESPFPRGFAARAAHIARRVPLLQAALLLCAGRAASALRGLATLSGDLTGGTAAFSLWATAAMALGHVALRHGGAFVARPLFALDAQAQR